jgi:hypothetical protein
MKLTAIVKCAFRFGSGLIAAILCMTNLPVLRADNFTVSGEITQSVQDGTGPAVNNPDLNNLSDGATYTVSLTFDGSITSPGTYDLTGLTLVFSAGGVVEDSFSSASVTITQSGGFDQISVLGCLTTGSGCNQGNELDLNFQMPLGPLTGNIAAQEIPGLLPLELLEDDGVTDIHGALADNTAPPAVPEPSAVILSVSGLLMMALTRIGRRSKRQWQQ